MLKRTFYTGANVLFLVAAVAIFFYLVFSIGGRTVQLYRLQGEAAHLRGKIDLLKEENQRLAEKKEMVSSDAYIEKVAREELGMARPEDKAVIIVSLDDSAPGSGKETPPEADTRPYWRQWWDMLFGSDKPPS